MKILARTYSDKDYEVVVYPKYTRGPITSKILQHWCLSSNSLENCRWFAIDILSGMSPEEIFGDVDLLPSEVRSSLLDSFIRRYQVELDETIGFDIASRAFGVEVSKNF